eukprot:1447210-Rhodomonas_salina.1
MRCENRSTHIDRFLTTPGHNVERPPFRSKFKWQLMPGTIVEPASGAEGATARNPNVRSQRRSFTFSAATVSTRTIQIQSFKFDPAAVTLLIQRPVPIPH